MPRDNAMISSNELVRNQIDDALCNQRPPCICSLHINDHLEWTIHWLFDPNGVALKKLSRQML